MTNSDTSLGGRDNAPRSPAADPVGRAWNDATEDATAASPAAVGSTDVAPDLAGLIGAAVRDELDAILPHVLAAIKRDRAFDELSDRLSRAERRLEARRERPLAVAIHRLLNRMRHLDFDQAVKASLEAELVKILSDVGFDEMGRVSEEYDPARHDALDGQVIDGQGTVTEVHASGLSSFGDVIVRAQVRVSPRPMSRPQADEASHRESSTKSAS